MPSRSTYLLPFEVIETERRPDDWVARLRDRPGVWESGQTEAEAIGKLVVSYEATR